jgi:hypothetical protein
VRRGFCVAGVVTLLAVADLDRSVAAPNPMRRQSVTKGTAVTYEGVVQKHGRKSEVAVDAGGKLIKP